MEDIIQAILYALLTKAVGSKVSFLVSKGGWSLVNGLGWKCWFIIYGIEIYRFSIACMLVANLTLGANIHGVTSFWYWVSRSLIDRYVLSKTPLRISCSRISKHYKTFYPGFDGRTNYIVCYMSSSRLESDNYPVCGIRSVKLFHPLVLKPINSCFLRIFENIFKEEVTLLMVKHYFNNVWILLLRLSDSVCKEYLSFAISNEYLYQKTLAHKQTMKAKSNFFRCFMAYLTNWFTID